MGVARNLFHWSADRTKCFVEKLRKRDGYSQRTIGIGVKVRTDGATEELIQKKVI